MPRKKTICQNQYPYHITARCINKEWFNLSMETVWQVFSEELYMTHLIYGLKVHSFVLMSNHYHLIASTPLSNLPKCMQFFSSNSSKRLTKLGNRINQTFAGRYFKTVLQQPNYYLNAYKYVYRNPVEAGITHKVQLYPYSSLNLKLKGSQNLFPFDFDDTLFPDTEDTLRWLNRAPNKDTNDAVKKALKKKYFKSRIDKKSKLPLVDFDTLI